MNDTRNIKDRIEALRLIGLFRTNEKEYEVHVKSILYSCK